MPQSSAVADTTAAATAAAAAVPARVADAEKQAAIKAAFLHAWKGYRTHAWGKDELQPVSEQGRRCAACFGVLACAPGRSPISLAGCKPACNEVLMPCRHVWGHGTLLALAPASCHISAATEGVLLPHPLSPGLCRQNHDMVPVQQFTSCAVILCSSENAPFADMAATLVDSLSSLWMLGFREEFQV